MLEELDTVNAIINDVEVELLIHHNNDYARHLLNLINAQREIVALLDKWLVLKAE